MSLPGAPLSVPDERRADRDRTAQVVLLVVEELSAQGLVRGSPKAVLTAACNAVGLPLDALVPAAQALRGQPWRPPPAHVEPEGDPPRPPTLTVVAAPPPAEPAVAPPRRGRPWNSRQPRPGDTHMRCGRCKQDKPLGEFSRRADLPGIRWTVCDTCRRKRQRERYLSVEKVRMLKAARLTFTVSDADEYAGLACMECGARVVPGDEVFSLSGLHHTRCPVPREARRGVRC